MVGPEDAAALAALKAETFVETFAEDNDPVHVRAHVAREFTADAVRRSLEDDASTTWWLLDGGVPVGFLKVNRGHAQTEPGLDDGLEVEQIYVLAAHHGRGHGSRLIDHAMHTARAEGHAFIWLGVWEHNRRAIAVYEHRGFVPIGDHTFLFGDEEQRDVLMRRDL
jgi:diamine N-acetyltransferase